MYLETPARFALPLDPTPITGRMTTLNILHTVEFYYPHTGGSERVVQAVSEALAKRGHSVTVATSAITERDFTELNGVTVVEFDVVGSSASGLCGDDIHRYQRFLTTFPADVMMNYAAQQWATDLAFNVVDRVADSRANLVAPCGYSALRNVSELRWPAFKDYYRDVIPSIIPKYDAAIYHSARYQDYRFAQQHGFRNGVVIPNGVSAAEFDAPAQIDFRAEYGIRTAYMGLCVANFFADKGHDALIRAVQSMSRSDFTLVLIGKFGPQLDGVRDLAEGLNIEILVDIPRSHTVSAFKAADLFLFASRVEAAPLVIIEAMASATPFVSTDCGNVRDYAGGIVCRVEELASESSKLLADPDLRAELGRAGYRQWRSGLTWESLVDTYETLYLETYRKKLAGSRGWREDTDAIQHRIEQDYADASLYMRAALAHQRLGRIDAARTYMEDALELEPDNPFAEQWLRKSREYGAD